MQEKLEIPTAPAILCKTCKNGETRSKTNDFKSKFAFIMEASESTRLRMEESLPNYHEDHIAGRGDNSLQHYNWYTNLVLCSSKWDTRSKSSSGWRMGETWKDSRVGPDKSQKQIRGDRWSKDERNKSSFCLTDGFMSSEKCWVGGDAPNTKVELYSEATSWKMILDLMQYLQSKDHQHLKWQPPKSWISSPDCQIAMDKQQTQYQRKPK